MKIAWTIVALALSVSAVKGQKGDEKIDESTVPAAVRATQAKAYAGIAVTKWELHKGKNPSKGNHYTAQFTDATAKKVHVRYDLSGAMLGRSTYFDEQHVPSPVSAAVAARYAAYKITGVEQVENIKKQKNWYEVKLKGEPGKKTVKLDLQGNEIPKEKAEQGDE